MATCSSNFATGIFRAAKGSGNFATGIFRPSEGSGNFVTGIFRPSEGSRNFVTGIFRAAANGRFRGTVASLLSFVERPTGHVSMRIVLSSF
jgi:hypothetical protein